MFAWLKFPKTATAPFCPTEAGESVLVNDGAKVWQKALMFVGPGFLISVGYMDPGNWATDIAAGSKFGYALLWVVVASSLVAIFLQYLSLKLGIVTRRDLAQHIHAEFSPGSNFVLWILGEGSIIACDLAEVLGTALAFKLLFGCSLVVGVLLTSLDTVIVLSLQRRGFRNLEAIILGLIATISICFLVELTLAPPHWLEIWSSFGNFRETFQNRDSIYLAIGILGATIMPHNLYLHSSIVQTRKFSGDSKGSAQGIRYASLDSAIALIFALLINAGILILAADVFHFSGHQDVGEIEDAYRLLSPLVGTWLGGILFAVALLASGQSSTFTGTIAGQVLMEGHMNWKIPCWQRRLITRSLALIPALLGVIYLGEGSVGRLLILSQVVLSLQLPFAMFPLIRFVSSAHLMGRLRISKIAEYFAWVFFAGISAANIWLIVRLIQN